MAKARHRYVKKEVDRAAGASEQPAFSELTVRIPTVNLPELNEAVGRNARSTVAEYLADHGIRLAKRANAKAVLAETADDEDDDETTPEVKESVKQVLTGLGDVPPPRDG